MEKNTDLRILEKRIKTFKFLTILFSILTPLPLLGIGLKFPYSYGWKVVRAEETVTDYRGGLAIWLAILTI